MYMMEVSQSIESLSEIFMACEQLW